MDPLTLLQALQEEHVNFVLVGGLACAIVGTTRVTRDINIAYAGNFENLESMCRVLNRFSPRYKALGNEANEPLCITLTLLKRHPMLQLITDIGEVEALRNLDGFNSYGHVKRMSNATTLSGCRLPVPVLSIDGQLRTKRALRRPKDIQDIVELEAIQAATLTSLHVKPL